MRRLPIYFVIDVSESMVGDPIKNVQEGVSTIVTELKKDPYALETVHISVIAFAGRAKTLTRLTDIINFTPPKLSIGAGTSYTKALRHLIQDINQNIVRTTLQQKGDWKPIIYFMTDGNPTDDFESALSSWEKQHKDQNNVVVISIGDNCDHNILKRISNNILAFDDSNPDSYKEFFKWVTSSIKMQSQKVDNGGNDDELDLNSIDETNLKKLTSSASRIDERYAIFHGKCQNTKKEYLIKYMRSRESSSMGEINYAVRGYKLVGAFHLDKSYYSLSDEAHTIQQTISTNELSGSAGCPNCSNSIALCLCPCGNIFCVDGEGYHTCPWCNLQRHIRRVSSMDVQPNEG